MAGRMAGDWATVVIPTRQSARWIGALLAHYAARGVTPVILLDDRTTDDTRRICRAAGARVVDIHGFTITEAIVSVTRDCVATPWALFIHDDEAPSDALLARLRGPPPPEGATSVAISRRWAWHEPGRPLRYGRSDQWHDRTDRVGCDHHWRLFQPREVEFIAVMHTDGFRIRRWSRFGPDAHIVHFEWVIRTLEQRREKLRRYDAVRDGYGRFFEKVYLPEIQPPGVIEYRPLAGEGLETLARAYHAVRAAAPDAPPRLRARLAALLPRPRPVRRDPHAMPETEPADRVGLNPRPELEIPDRPAASGTAA